MTDTRYTCERCGGTGQQAAGCWSGTAYDALAGVCQLCNGEGKLGIKESETVSTFGTTVSEPAPKREKPGRPKIHVDAILVGVKIPPDLLTLLDKEAGDGSRQAAILRILRRGLESNGG